MSSVLKLLLGFILLVWGADRFVSGACAVARKLGIPAVVVGLTIVALGTSAPELSVSLTAALQGANEIAVGNVVGSNLFNLLAVVGVSAAIAPMRAEPGLLRRDLPLSGLASATLLLMLLLGQGSLRRGGGLVLLVGMFVYLFVLVREALKKQLSDHAAALSVPLWTIPLNLAAGLGGIVLGGSLTVGGATGIARMFGWSEALIGLTIVAVGTSLPELVTSVTAAIKGESGLALGNAVGSNLFNILFILGSSAAICPIRISRDVLTDVAILTAVSAVCTLLMRRKGGVSRGMGIAMASGYLAYMGWLIVR